MRAYVDVETTGFSRGAGAVIVEVGCVVVNDQWDEVATFSAVINPGAKAMEMKDVDNALKVNGLTREHIARGLRGDLISAGLIHLISEVSFDNRHAFNVNFDKKFLAHKPWTISEEHWGECIMLAAQKAMGVGKWPKLGEAAEYFDVEMPDAHRALGDARATMQIHRKILQ